MVVSQQRDGEQCHEADDAEEHGPLGIVEPGLPRRLLDAGAVEPLDACDDPSMSVSSPSMASEPPVASAAYSER